MEGETSQSKNNNVANTILASLEALTHSMDKVQMDISSLKGELSTIRVYVYYEWDVGLCGMSKELPTLYSSKL